MNSDNIIIIDNKRYYYDNENDCIIPIDNENIYKNLENEPNNINKNDYLNNSLKLFDKIDEKIQYPIIKDIHINTNTNTNTNINNDEYENITKLNEWYMENYDIDFWENILSRNLDKDERKIIHGIWNETSLNIDIKVLQKNLIKHNCYIKSITNNIGNCLFESLASLGLGDNDLGISAHNMIRKSLAIVLLMVKTEVGFFPKIDLTPEEIFTNANDSF